MLFGFSPEADRELAGGSIRMVVMVGGAFGATLAIRRLPVPVRPVAAE